MYCRFEMRIIFAHCTSWADIIFSFSSAFHISSCCSYMRHLFSPELSVVIVAGFHCFPERDPVSQVWLLMFDDVYPFAQVFLNLWCPCRFCSSHKNFAPTGLLKLTTKNNSPNWIPQSCFNWGWSLRVAVRRTGDTPCWIYGRFWVCCGRFPDHTPVYLVAVQGFDHLPRYASSAISNILLVIYW